MKQAELDTIIAEATPPGRGSLRVVRLSGPGAVTFLKEHWNAEGGAKPWDSPRRLCLGTLIRRPGLILDRCLSVVFPAPDSLTGEDVVEIHAHGAPGVVRGVLDGACEGGLRLALPGEFSFRAFLNGKISLLEAESVAALVEAQTAGQAASAGSALWGTLEKSLREMRERLLDLRAEWEAAINFPEDFSESSEPVGREALAGIARSLEKILENSGCLKQIREGWRVAIAGPANSGKSSLFNALLRRERALVTPHPGTTRDVIEETLQIGEYPVILMDTAGIRHAEDEVESLGISRGLEMTHGADGVLFVFDGHGGWGTEQEAALDRLPRKPLALLSNKSDLGMGGTVPEGALPISARTGDGLEGVVTLLREWMETQAPSGLARLCSQRQIEAVQQAREGCEQALKTLEVGEGEDLASVGLIQAQEALDQCLDGGGAEDLYERIFSRFCIGK